MNPAVTFAMCFMAREPWIKLPIYALAQTLGAFLGAGIVYGLYYGEWIVYAGCLLLLQASYPGLALQPVEERVSLRCRAYAQHMDDMNNNNNNTVIMMIVTIFIVCSSGQSISHTFSCSILTPDLYDRRILFPPIADGGLSRLGEGGLLKAMAEARFEPPETS